MISLATSPTHNRISPEPAEPKPASTDGGRPGSGFSAVLAQHSPQKTEPKNTSAQATPTDATGAVMPEAAKTGKSLPVALPGEADQADSEDTATDSDEAVAQAAAEAILAAVGVPQPPLLAAPGVTEADAQPAGARQARPAFLPPRPAQASGAVAGEPKAAAEKSTGATVALQVAPQPGAQPAGPTMDTHTESDASTARPRAAAIERAAAQPATADTARQTDFASLVTPVSATPTPAVSANGEARPPMQANALQDLTRIVDRLAAAREVFAPATEALSITHAEFGELSLRFDQRRDGLLSVQVSASNPDAHRAVAQAVGAQTFHSAADGQPQGQSQNPSQGQTQMGARGGTADRDGNPNAARHEQPQPQQQHRAAPQPAHADGRQPAGIFA